MSEMNNWVVMTIADGEERRFAADELPVSIGGGAENSVCLHGIPGSLQIGELDGAFFIQPGRDTRNLRVEGEPVTVRLPGSEEPVTFSMDMAGNQILVSVNGMQSAAEDVNPYAGVLVDVADGSTKRIVLPCGPWTCAN